MKFSLKKYIKHKKLSSFLIAILCSVAFYFLIICLFELYLLAGSTKIGSVKKCAVYTDDLVYKDDIMHIMDTCVSELEKKDIIAKSTVKIVFCTTVEQYNKRSFLGKGSLGYNSPIVKTILLAPAKYKDNIQDKHDKNLMNRRLSDAIMHEITHTYIEEQIGFLKNFYMRFFEKWKIEGFCEYVANSSSLNIEDGKRIFIENGEERKKIESNKDIWYYTYFYFKSRLKTDYLFSYKHYSFDQFIQEDINNETLENEIREKLRSGEYVFNKQ